MTLPTSLRSRLQDLHHEMNVDDFSQALRDVRELVDSNGIIEGLRLWLDTLLGTSLSIVAKKPLVDSFIEGLREANAEVQTAVGRYAIDSLRTAVAFFEDQDTALRELLANTFTTEEQYAEAAKILQGIQLESSQRKISDIDRFNIWIRICRLYLEEDDTTTAEMYLNRAKNILYQVDDREAQLKFKLSQARISDAQRRFLEAGTVYHDISTVSLLADEERDLTLGKAIVCAILAPAGLARTTLLRKLHRDERARNLDEYPMLENMYLGRLISPAQSDAFASKLDPHQVAPTSDGSTVLAKAVIEHNLLGISELYEHISGIELAMLLGLKPERAEEYAARMIEQQRLSASIDHVNGFINFGCKSDGQQTCRFDDRVRCLLEDVERVASLLQI